MIEPTSEQVPQKVVQIPFVTPRINFFQFEWENNSLARGAEDDAFIMIAVLAVEQGRSEALRWDIFDFEELELLKKFQDVVCQRIDETWVGWDCSDFETGFNRVGTRYRELISEDYHTPQQVLDLQRLLRANLDQLFITEPSLQNAARFYDMDPWGMFPSIANQHFVKNKHDRDLRQSTSKKLQTISNVFGLAVELVVPDPREDENPEAKVEVENSQDEPFYAGDAAAEDIPVMKLEQFAGDSPRIELLKIYSGGTLDPRFNEVMHVAEKDIKTDQKLREMDKILPIPANATAQQLAKFLRVSRQAVAKTNWWETHRKGNRALRSEERRQRLKEKGKCFEQGSEFETD